MVVVVGNLLQFLLDFMKGLLRVVLQLESQLELGDKVFLSRLQVLNQNFSLNLL